MTMRLSLTVSQQFCCRTLSHPGDLFSDAAAKVRARRVTDLKEFVSQCDIITVNAPLHDGTKGLINADLLKHFKKVRSHPAQLSCYSLTILLRVRGS